MGSLYRAYKNTVPFLLVYVKEAHPDDGRQMEANRQAGVVYNTPTTLQERARIATDCVKSLKLDFPCLLDDMQNTVQQAYNGWPARFCLVDREGRIAYISRNGPRGITGQELGDALKRFTSISQ